MLSCAAAKLFPATAPAPKHTLQMNGEELLCDLRCVWNGFSYVCTYVCAHVRRRCVKGMLMQPPPPKGAIAAPAHRWGCCTSYYGVETMIPLCSARAFRDQVSKNKKAAAVKKKKKAAGVMKVFCFSCLFPPPQHHPASRPLMFTYSVSISSCNNRIWFPPRLFFFLWLIHWPVQHPFPLSSNLFLLPSFENKYIKTVWMYCLLIYLSLHSDGFTGLMISSLFYNLALVKWLLFVTLL